MGVFAKAYQSQLESLEKETNPKILDYWARRPSGYPKRNYIIAQNPHTSKKTLHKLSKSCITSIRVAVAMNPNTSRRTLHKLSKDNDTEVKIFVARNPNTSRKTLHYLAKYAITDVRVQVAKNNNISFRTWNLLLNNWDYRVITAALKHPKSQDYAKRIKPSKF